MTKAEISQIVRTIFFLITIFLFNLPAQAKYSGGTGEPDNPYQIAVAEDLMLLGYSTKDYDKQFILTADIDLDPNLPGRKTFREAVIASDWPYFNGTFDGNDHTISNLTIKGREYLGLFGRLDPGAKISNLSLKAVDIEGTDYYVGSLVGWNKEGEIINCYSTGIVSGDSMVGGLVGANWCSVAASISTCTVTGSGYGIGGLAGENNEGSITTSYSTGTISGDFYVGGLVGLNRGGIIKSYSTGAVTGIGKGVGGLVGGGSGVLNSVWDVETSVISGTSGGVGLTTSEMMDPYMLGLNGFANDPNWVLDPGSDYPRLYWEGTIGDIIPEPDIDWIQGYGTQEQPYRIDTADQLILLGKASILWNKWFILGANIDLDPNLTNGQIFRQAVIPQFTGVFDGNDLAIYNLVITGSSNLGLFGRLKDGAVARNLGIVDVNITGSDYEIGGLVGRNENGSITDSYCTGLITGGSNVGCLVGSNLGNIVRSYGTGTITGDKHIGGLVGRNDGGSIATCFSTGTVSGNSYIGGLAGWNYGDITLCYSSGSTSGKDNVGGLVGHIRLSFIVMSYSCARVSGRTNVGGLVGSSYQSDEDPDPLNISNSCFWDIQTSGQVDSVWGIGKTTTEMQTSVTYLEAGWDFVDETENGTEDVWRILEGQDYPRLWWEAE